MRHIIISDGGDRWIFSVKPFPAYRSRLGAELPVFGVQPEQWFQVSAYGALVYMGPDRAQAEKIASDQRPEFPFGFLGPKVKRVTPILPENRFEVGRMSIDERRERIVVVGGVDVTSRCLCLFGVNGRIFEPATSAKVLMGAYDRRRSELVVLMDEGDRIAFSSTSTRESEIRWWMLEDGCMVSGSWSSVLEFWALHDLGRLIIFS